MTAKPRVVFLRPDQSLSAYEMDYIKLLNDEFDLRILTTGTSAIGGEPENVTRLAWPDEFDAGGRKRSLLNALYARLLKRRYHIPGLAPRLQDAEIVQAGEAAGEVSYQAARLKERFGFRLILSASENLPILENRTKSELERIQLTLAAADHAIAISKAAKHRLVEAGLSDDKITVIGHGIDCERFSPTPRKPGPMRIGYCGRFRREKGVEHLCRATKDLDAELVLLGSGPDEEFLRQLRPDAVFLDPLPYNRMHEFYREIDIFVLPSIPVPGIDEQFGFVLLEAMASEIPVVSSNTGAISEVLDDAGILVPPADEQQLNTQLARLIKDETLRQDLAQKGRDRVLENFTHQKIAARFAEVYRHQLAS